MVYEVLMRLMPHFGFYQVQQPERNNVYVSVWMPVAVTPSSLLSNILSIIVSR